MSSVSRERSGCENTEGKTHKITKIKEMGCLKLNGSEKNLIIQSNTSLSVENIEYHQIDCRTHKNFVNLLGKT